MPLNNKRSRSRVSSVSSNVVYETEPEPDSDSDSEVEVEVEARINTPSVSNSPVHRSPSPMEWNPDNVDFDQANQTPTPPSSQTRLPSIDFSRVYNEWNDSQMISELFGELPSEHSRLPNRTLDNFRLYQITDGVEELIPFRDFYDDEEDKDNNLISNRGWNFSCRGRALPWSPTEEEDDDEDDFLDDGIEVEINGLITSYTDHGSYIWIRTSLAWYILLTPHHAYTPFYVDCWTRQWLLSIICRITAKNSPISSDPDSDDAEDLGEQVLTIPKLLESLTPEAKLDELLGSILTRPPKQEDLNKHGKWILGHMRYLDVKDYYTWELDYTHPLYTSLAKKYGKGKLHAPPRKHTTPSTASSKVDREEPDYAGSARASPISSINGGNEADPPPVQAREFEAARQKSKRISTQKLLRMWQDPREALEGTVVGRNAETLYAMIPNNILSDHEVRETVEQETEPVFGYDPDSLRMSMSNVSVSPDHTVPVVQRNHSRIDKYRIGDFVVLTTRPGTVPEFTRQLRGSPASISISNYANTFWFARIIEFRKKGKEAHVQWALHGSRTMLQETHHPRELFLTFTCAWVPVHLFVQIVPVDHFVNPNGPLWRTSERDGENRFYCRFAVDERDGSFHSIPSAARSKPPSCIAIECCKAEPSPPEDRPPRYHIRVSDGSKHHSITSFRYNGEEYHEGDFVYLTPKGGPRPCYDDDLLVIAQIKVAGYKSDANGFPRTLKVRIFERANAKQLSRHLVLSEDHLRTRSISRLAGKCMIMTTEEFTSRRDYVNGDVFGRFPHLWHVDGGDLELLNVLPLSLSPSPSSSSSRAKRLRLTSEALLAPCLVCRRKFDEHDTGARPHLRHMDVFSGGGGFTQGFVRAGAIDVKAALDISPSACKTFKKLYPGAIVVCDDINNYIIGIAKIAEGRKTSLRTIHGEKVYDIPQKGDIDSMTLSPPCTPFSGLNRFKNTSDLRITYIVSGLALVEYYKPTYVTIENVLAMARYAVRVLDHENGEVLGKIRWGIHKFILRTLLDLGYQVRCAHLNAADYGTPSARDRVIYIAARHASPPIVPSAPYPIRQLPQMPRPTNVVIVKSLKNTRFNVPGVNVLFPSAPGRNPDGSAAHLPVKVKEAIEDLPKFDWRSELESRPGIPVVKAGSKFNVNRKGKRRKDKRCGLEDGPYAGESEEPANDYQRWVRAGSTVATHTYTAVFGEDTTARVTMIPIAAGANHTSLSKEYEISAFVSTTGAAARNKLYPNSFRRLGNKEQFQTVVTELNPLRKQGRVLHPDQRRVLTVREYARAQGFSDTTDFQSTGRGETDRYAQIGNAIPVPLSMAIARSIVDSLLDEDD